MFTVRPSAPVSAPFIPVVVSKKYTKKRDARAEKLFWPLKLLFFWSRRCGRRRSCLSSLLMSLSKDVFGRHTSTGSEAFSLLICLNPLSPNICIQILQTGLHTFP